MFIWEDVYSTTIISMGFQALNTRLLSRPNGQVTLQQEQVSIIRVFSR